MLRKNAIILLLLFSLIFQFVSVSGTPSEVQQGELALSSAKNISRPNYQVNHIMYGHQPFLSARTRKAVQSTSEYGSDIPMSLARQVQTYLNSSYPITNLYYEPHLYDDVVAFLTAKTGSEKVTETLLFFIEKENLFIEIVFSLVFVESSFKLDALNFNSQSSDYGLFQLNSKTFRHISQEDLFHLETNVKLGTQYLRYAFNLMSDVDNALAIYNAGPSRPLNGQIPQSTLKYVKKINSYSRELIEEFKQYMSTKFSLG